MPLFRDDLEEFAKQFGDYSTLVEELDLTEKDVELLLQKSELFDKKSVRFRIPKRLLKRVGMQPFSVDTAKEVVEKEIARLFDRDKGLDPKSLRIIDTYPLKIELDPYVALEFLTSDKLFDMDVKNATELLEGR